MTLTDLFVYSLAVWRVANLFVNERGPFDVFVKFRVVSGITVDEDGVSIEIPDTFFAQVLSCVWCASIWVAFWWTGLWLISPEWALKIAVPFAMSGGAVLLETWRYRK